MEGTVLCSSFCAARHATARGSSSFSKAYSSRPEIGGLTVDLHPAEMVSATTPLASKTSKFKSRHLWSDNRQAMQSPARVIPVNCNGGAVLKSC